MPVSGSVTAVRCGSQCVAVARSALLWLGRVPTDCSPRWEAAERACDSFRTESSDSSLELSGFWSSQVVYHFNLYDVTHRAEILLVSKSDS